MKVVWEGGLALCCVFGGKVRVFLFPICRESVVRRGIHIIVGTSLLGVAVCSGSIATVNLVFGRVDSGSSSTTPLGLSPHELCAFLVLALSFLVFGGIIAFLDARYGRLRNAVHEMETRFRELFDHMTDGVAVYEAVRGGEDFVIRDMNRAGERICGIDRKKVLGEYVTTAFPSVKEFGLFEVLQRVWRTGRPEQHPAKHYSDTRSSFWADNYVYRLPTGEVVAVFDDVTERERSEQQRRALEAQVQHAQKLESLGILAGGIAHDFNNLLMGILGNADLALNDASLASKARRHLKEIETTSRRAADLCRQMLTYSGKSQISVQPLDLSELVRDMVGLLKISISKKSDLHCSFGKDLPPIEGDPTQLRQVIMNLITNASDAIGGEEGTITVGTRSLECSRAYLDTTYVNEDLPEGKYVCLDVSDSGCGMDLETQNRIFDPFYTTKSTGRGLGLAVVIGIVRGHRGAIKVYSEPGKGTSFRVLFPASRRFLEPRGKESAPESEWRGSGCILVVDDDNVIRNLAKNMLERGGFTVLTANDGEDALRVFREHHEEVSLVLLDMTMPRMNGEETFRELTQIRADIPVIISSGYGEQETMGQFREKGIAGFIQKPYQTRDLMRVLRGILDPTPPTPAARA